MIPISDDNPARLMPVVTWLIIALCVAAYLWERSLGHDMEAAIEHFNSIETHDVADDGFMADSELEDLVNVDFQNVLP